MWDAPMTLKAPLKLYLNRFWGPLSITALKRLHKNITDKFSIACTWLQQRANGNGDSTRPTERGAWGAWGKSERIQKKQELFRKKKWERKWDRKREKWITGKGTAYMQIVWCFSHQLVRKNPIAPAEYDEKSFHYTYAITGKNTSFLIDKNINTLH